MLPSASVRRNDGLQTVVNTAAMRNECLTDLRMPISLKNIFLNGVMLTACTVATVRAATVASLSPLFREYLG
jgi:heme/copper-type cytochrome/quinol oxidase subunit 1